MFALSPIAQCHSGQYLAIALQLLNEAGYRDYLWLQILPPFSGLLDEPEFLAMITSMRDDVARQRAQVLTADWLPPELRIVDTASQE